MLAADVKQLKSHVLVVDDEPTIRNIFEAVFKDECERGVLEFSYSLSGEAALGEVLKNKATVDDLVCVLSDVNMPGMSGLELLAEIRKKDQNLTVCMVSANDENDCAVIAKTLGADDFFIKPLDFKQIKKYLLEKVEENNK